MFFTNDYIVFEILDVIKLEQDSAKIYNRNRNFDALSFRYDADTLIETNNESFRLAENSVTYFPANVNYMRESKYDKMFVIHFKTFNCHTGNIETFIPKNPQLYRNLFEKIYKIWKEKNTSYKNSCSILLYEIFSQIYKDNKKDSEDNSPIENSVKYILKHFNDTNFSLPEAVKKSHFSEQYFRRIFKAKFNMSPKEYIIHLRLNYAKSLLLTGYYTIQETAYLCGYTDNKHFSSEFKKRVGICPSDYVYNFNTKN